VCVCVCIDVYVGVSVMYNAYTRTTLCDTHNTRAGPVFMLQTIIALTRNARAIAFTVGGLALYGYTRT
jgi:hypothetical protein